MMKRTRREFLEDSMFAAAAASVAGASTQVFAEEKQSSSANEKLSVAVVGVRGRGGSHISAFAGRKDTEITYVCDADEGVGQGRAAQIDKRQRKPKFEKDIRKVLEDKSVDIVTIATPNHWHSLIAIWAMQAGKDVYVEKPVSHNVSEGRRLVEAARKYKRICQTGTQSRSNPGMQAAVKYVHDEKIGKLQVARGLCYKRRGSIGAKGNYDLPKGLDYNLWCGPAPMVPLTRPRLHYDWHWIWATGNGDLGNQGIHQMDIARWGLNIDQLSSAVISYGGRFGYEDAGETANTQVVVHDFGDRSLVFEVRGLPTGAYKGAKIGVMFEGSDGFVVIPSYAGGAAFDKDGNKVATFSGAGNHYANFLKAVRSRKHTDLNADILEGHLSSALCHMGNISLWRGVQANGTEALERMKTVKTVENVVATYERTAQHLADNKLSLDKTKLTLGKLLAFDPKSETFKDDSVADALLTREYRKPFVVPGKGEV